MKITSLNNEKVVAWAKLKMKKYRDVEHLFIVESENLVREALKKNIVKEIITLEPRNEQVPVYEVTEEIMKRLTSLINPPKVMAVCSYILPDDITGNVLILDKVQDPGNFGTIIRSAVAFDFKTIIISPDTVDMYNDKVIRSSEGMIFNVNIIKGDLPEAINYLKSKEYTIIGTDVVEGKIPRKFKNKKCAYIMGNEGNGMSAEIRALCDDFISINISPLCESLNVAVAASIIMHEVYHE